MELTGHSVLILPDQIPETTTSGIVVPKTIKELPNTGKVIGVGPATDVVRPGERVTFIRKAGSAVYIEDVEHLIIHEAKIQFIHG